MTSSQTRHSGRFGRRTDFGIRSTLSSCQDSYCSTRGLFLLCTLLARSLLTLSRFKSSRGCSLVESLAESLTIKEATIVVTIRFAFAFQVRAPPSTEQDYASLGTFSSPFRFSTHTETTSRRRITPPSETIYNKADKPRLLKTRLPFLAAIQGEQCLKLQEVVAR